jgi:transcriptional regulator with XRE-family HTH domain
MSKLTRMNTAFLLKLLEARNISPAELAREIKESQQTVHNWKARGRYPASKVPKIAKFLRITADELMAGKLAEAVETNELGALSDEEESLVLAWRTLPVEMKQQIHLALQQYQAALLNFPALANGTFSAGLRANQHFEKVQAHSRIPGKASARVKKTK